MVRILFRELARKDLSKKIDTGEEFRIFFPSEFCFSACNAPMICIEPLSGIFHIDASKSDSVGEQRRSRSFALFLLLKRVF